MKPNRSRFPDFGRVLVFVGTHRTAQRHDGGGEQARFNGGG